MGNNHDYMFNYLFDVIGAGNDEDDVYSEMSDIMERTDKSSTDIDNMSRKQVKTLINNYYDKY